MKTDLEVWSYKEIILPDLSGGRLEGYSTRC